MYNAVNLIDGLDGLAAGLVLFISIFCVFFTEGLFQKVNISIFVCYLVFMIFNQRPAKTFMGDAGSLFSGFYVASLPLLFFDMHTHYESNSIDMTVFVIITSFLIADTTRVFFTRILSGKSPMSADTIHFHHMIIKNSGSYLVTLGTIFFISAILTYCAILTIKHNGNIQPALIFHLSAIFIFILTKPAQTYNKFFSGIIGYIYKWDNVIGQSSVGEKSRNALIFLLIIAFDFSIVYNLSNYKIFGSHFIIALVSLIVFIFLNRNDKKIIYALQVFVSIFIIENFWLYNFNFTDKVLMLFLLISFIIFGFQKLPGIKLHKFFCP